MSKVKIIRGSDTMAGMFGYDSMDELKEEINRNRDVRLGALFAISIVLGEVEVTAILTLMLVLHSVAGIKLETIEDLLEYLNIHLSNNELMDLSSKLMLMEKITNGKDK